MEEPHSFTPFMVKRGEEREEEGRGKGRGATRTNFDDCRSTKFTSGGALTCVTMVQAGAQSDTLGLLRRNDRKSRHRRIKKQRRYERLAATKQLS